MFLLQQPCEIRVINRDYETDWWGGLHKVTELEWQSQNSSTSATLLPAPNPMCFLLYQADPANKGHA